MSSEEKIERTQAVSLSCKWMCYSQKYSKGVFYVLKQGQVNLILSFSHEFIVWLIWQLCYFLELQSGEGNDTPLQYSCLENPMGGGAWYLQSMGSLRVGHDWATSLSLFTFMHWRRKWQPTPLFLPGESQRQWAPIYGVTQSRTWLKRLSSSSSSSSRAAINK